MYSYTRSFTNQMDQVKERAKAVIPAHSCYIITITVEGIDNDITDELVDLYNFPENVPNTILHQPNTINLIFNDRGGIYLNGDHNSICSDYLSKTFNCLHEQGYMNGYTDVRARITRFDSQTAMVSFIGSEMIKDKNTVLEKADGTKYGEEYDATKGDKFRRFVLT